MLSEQVLEEHGAMNNGEQVSDHIEEDDHTDNIVEYDGTNILIHDSFNYKLKTSYEISSRKSAFRTSTGGT